MICVIKYINNYRISHYSKITKYRSQITDNMDDQPNPEDMDYFNELCWTLDITTEKKKVNKPPSPYDLYHVPDMGDHVYDIEIVSIEASEISFSDDATDSLIDLSQEQLDKQIFPSPITLSQVLCGYDYDNTDKLIREYHDPSGWFTVDTLVNAIVEFEREARPRTRWFGGIDLHHIYFEGLTLQSDGSYEIEWGS